MFHSHLAGHRLTEAMRRLYALVLAGILLVVVAGVAHGAIPSADGAISACKDNKGALKVINAEAGQTCNNNQQLLTWNEEGREGPAGPSGPEGPIGPSGPAGPAGPGSDAFVAQWTGNNLFLDPDNDYVVITQLVGLPAGSYVVTATVDLGVFGSVDAQVTCKLSNAPIPSSEQIIASSANHGQAVVVDVVTTLGTQNIQLLCRDRVGDQAFSQSATITAIKVATLTDVSP